MARKIRKNTLYHSTADEKKLQQDGYRAALYGRLSVETEEKRERDSIGTQMEFLRDYASSVPDLIVCDEYIDDDVTGTSFNRPEYERMMCDIDVGRINCIIVKDLSRFARDHIGAGEYLEKVFPQKGVRFIAITDQIDTLYGDGGIIVPFKNIINERYAKEASKKLTNNFKMMQESGLFCSSKPVYGYKRSDYDKHRLVIDEDAANVVRQIFDWYINGVTNHQICKNLEEAGVMSPLKYAMYKGYLPKNEEKYDKLHWNITRITKIVTMQQYCGDMVQNKNSSTFLETGKKKSFRYTNKDEWIIVENTHEAIISREDFAKAQAIAESKKEKYREQKTMNSKRKKPEYCLEGVLRCAHCGGSIQAKCKKNNGISEYRYVCLVHEQYGNVRCEKKSLSFEDTNQMIFLIIKRIIQTHLATEEIIERMNNSSKAVDELREIKQKKNGIVASLNHIKSLKSKLYVDFKEGIIMKEDYEYLHKNYCNEQTQLENELAAIEKKLDLFTIKKDTTASKTIRKYMNARKLTKPMVNAFIDTIVVDNEGQFDIKLKIKDEYDELMRQLILRKGD